MKHRRAFVAAILVVAVMCVGVGYAAMNDTINFTGEINYDADFEIVWGEANYADGILTEAEGAGSDTFTVSMNTTNWELGVAKSFTVPVVNTSRYAAENVAVQALTKTAVEDNYTVTAEVTGPTTIPVDGSTTVTVTVTMDSYPEAAVEGAAFTFKVYADQVTTTQPAN